MKLLPTCFVAFNTCRDFALFDVIEMPAWSCTCMCVHVSACLYMCMLFCACVCRAVPVCVHVVLGPKSTLLHIKLAPQLGQLWPWQQQWQHPQHLYDPLHAAAAAAASHFTARHTHPGTHTHTDTYTGKPSESLEQQHQHQHLQLAAHNQLQQKLPTPAPSALSFCLSNL